MISNDDMRSAQSKYDNRHPDDDGDCRGRCAYCSRKSVCYPDEISDDEYSSVEPYIDWRD